MDQQHQQVEVRSLKKSYTSCKTSKYSNTWDVRFTLITNGGMTLETANLNLCPFYQRRKRQRQLLLLRSARASDQRKSSSSSSSISSGSPRMLQGVVSIGEILGAELSDLIQFDPGSLLIS